MKVIVWCAALLVAVTVCAAAHATENFSIRITPGINFPLGPRLEDGSRLYVTGFSTAVTGEYEFPSAPLFFGQGLFEYTRSPTRADVPLSIVSLGAGAGIKKHILRDLQAVVSISGGYYQGLYSGDTGGSFFFKAQGGLTYPLNPTVSVGLHTSYNLYKSLYNGIGISLGTTFRLGAGRKRARMELREVTLSPLFPVLYSFYENHPIGRGVIVNGEKGAVRDVRVYLSIPQYMDTPKLCDTIDEIPAGAAKEVPFYALLNEQVLELTEGTKVTADIQVRYTYLGDERSISSQSTVQIYDRNAMTWDDDRKAATFVTVRDPSIMQFARNIGGIVGEEEIRAVNLNFRTAMALFEVLSLLGIHYVVDPKTPNADTSRNAFAVDYLQFPVQTLVYRAGDCDDLSILYNALLEAVGIETAFITVPGHIFAAFSLDMDADEAKETFSHPENIICTDGNCWVPVEVTLLQKGFLAAWAEGAREWKEYTGLGKAALYPVHKAWEVYEPAGITGDLSSVVLPRSAILIAVYKEVLNHFIEGEITDRAEALRRKIQETGGSPRYINRLGVLYARFGLYDQAQKAFEQAGAEEYVPALLNCAHIHYLKNNMGAARRYYEEAWKVDPENEAAILGVLRTSLKLNDTQAAVGALEALKKKNPALAKKYAYVQKQERQTGRASGQSTGEKIPWEQ